MVLLLLLLVEPILLLALLPLKTAPQLLQSAFSRTLTST
jgi:hypothetical protein